MKALCPSICGRAAVPSVSEVTLTAVLQLELGKQAEGIKCVTAQSQV